MSRIQGKKTIGELGEILAATKIIGIVGLSDKPDRPSYSVAAYLQEVGYRIIPVNPMISEVLGEKAYPSLRAVPEPIDLVDIFRRPEFVPPIVEEAIAIGAKVIWMQLGVVNKEAADRAEAAGLTVVMNSCLSTTHSHLRAIGRI